MNWFKGRRVSVSPAFFCVLIFFVMTDEQNLLLHILAAAAAHEMGHIAAVYLVGGRIDRFHISLFGGELVLRNPERLSYGKELVAVLAGPAVNLFFAMLFAQIGKNSVWEMGYILSGIHVSLGLFNLLPLRELDGGRALYLLLCWLTDPIAAERSMHIFYCFCFVLLLLLSVGLIRVAGLRISFALLLGWLLLCGLKETGIVKTQVSR